MDHINLLKLSVGTENVESLTAWQAQPRIHTGDGLPRHVTRMWPRRMAEVLAGGSIYWVIKGAILARQRVVRFDEATGDDGIRRCAFVLDPRIVRTLPQPRRPFQGWRYLAPQVAPADASARRQAETPLPPELSARLAEIGVL